MSSKEGEEGLGTRLMHVYTHGTGCTGCRSVLGLRGTDTVPNRGHFAD